MDNKYSDHPGTTMFPDALRTCRVVANQLESDNLLLDGDKITGIVHDLDNPDHTKALSALALSSVQTDLDNKYKDLDFKVDTTVLSPVLSNPLVSPYFYGSDWVISNNILIDDSKVYYTNNKPVSLLQATLKIPTSVITKPGKYFFSIDIDQLPSGNITIYSEKNKVLQVFTRPDSYQFETYVDDPSIAYFLITINDMALNDTCIISFCSVHHVKDIFDTFMDYKIRQYSFKDVANNIDDLSYKINNAIKEMEKYVSNESSKAISAVNLHRQNTANPHQVTLEQLSAAPRLHNHDPSDILGINQYIYDLIDFDNINLGLSLINSFQEHITNTNNPHHVNNAQVGLDKATIQEAIDGDIDTKYISPSVLKSTLANYNNLVIPLDYSRVSPSYIGTLTITNSKITSIPITKDKLYLIKFKNINNHNAQNVKVYIDSISNTNDVMNGFIQNGITLASNNDSFLLIPEQSGINSLSGTLLLDTSELTLFGTLIGSTLHKTDYTTLTSVAIPLQVTSKYTIARSDIHTLNFSPINENLETFVVVDISEITSTKYPEAIVDATPIGTIVNRLTNAPIPGYVLLDGSILDKAKYKSLYEYALSTYMISRDDYLKEIEETNYCYRFYTVDDTTFGIPNIRQSNLYYFMKALEVYIPN